MTRRIRDALRALLKCEHGDHEGDFCLKCGTKTDWNAVEKTAVDHRPPLTQEFMDAVFEKMMADMKADGDKLDAEITEAGIEALADKATR